MSKKAFVLVPLLASAALLAQIPETFKDLRVLPKDIKKRELIEEMKRFSIGTGLRCEGCHAGKGGPALEAMEWAEETERKTTARAMLRMVRAINEEHLAPLGRKGVKVTCATCHRGAAKPAPLDGPPSGGGPAGPPP